MSKYTVGYDHNPGLSVVYIYTIEVYIISMCKRI